MGRERPVFNCKDDGDDTDNVYAQVDKLKMSRKNIANFTRLLTKENFQFDIVDGMHGGPLVCSIDVTDESQNKEDLKKLFHGLKANLNRHQDEHVEQILKSDSSILVNDLMACFKRHSIMKKVKKGAVKKMCIDESDDDLDTDVGDSEGNCYDGNLKHDSENGNGMSSINEQILEKGYPEEIKEPVSILKKDKTYHPMSKEELKRIEREKKERVRQEKRLEKERRSIENQRIKEEERKLKREIKEMKNDFRQLRSQRRNKTTSKKSHKEEPLYAENSSNPRQEGMDTSMSGITNTTDDENSTGSSYKTTAEKPFQDLNVNDETVKKKSPKKSSSKSTNRSTDPKNKNPFQDDPTVNAKAGKKKPPKKSSTNKSKDSKNKVKFSTSPSTSESTRKGKNKSKRPNKSKPKRKKKQSKKMKVNYALVEKSTPNTRAFRGKKPRRTYQHFSDNFKQIENGRNVQDKAEFTSNNIGMLAPKNFRISKQEKFMIKSDRPGLIPPWNKTCSSERLICSQSLKTFDSTLL